MKSQEGLDSLVERNPLTKFLVFPATHSASDLWAMTLNIVTNLFQVPQGCQESAKSPKLILGSEVRVGVLVLCLLGAAGIWKPSLPPEISQKLSSLWPGMSLLAYHHTRRKEIEASWYFCLAIIYYPHTGNPRNSGSPGSLLWVRPYGSDVAFSPLLALTTVKASMNKRESRTNTRRKHSACTVPQFLKYHWCSRFSYSFWTCMNTKYVINLEVLWSTRW